MKEYGLILDGTIQAGTFEVITKTADKQEYQLFNLRILNQYFDLDLRKTKRKLHVITALCYNNDPAEQILKLQNDYRFCYIEASEEGCWVDNRHTVISKARLVLCD